MMTSSAELAQMPVTDAFPGERVRQRVPVELRDRTRTRDRAHVHEQRDVNLPQERHEFGERPRGVADGEDRIARLMTPKWYAIRRLSHQCPASSATPARALKTFSRSSADAFEGEAVLVANEFAM